MYAAGTSSQCENCRNQLCMVFNDYIAFPKISSVLYAQDVSIALFIAVAFVAISLYIHFFKGQYRTALFFMLAAGFGLLLFMACVDPYLHDWDERFHALVAKNLMTYPLKPMLRINPVLPYHTEDWMTNHIWLHKEPLFLWQMALAMKIFGTNEVALRIPSVLMGMITIFLIYDGTRLWLKDRDIAIIAALLYTLSYYHLELTSGLLSTDHNDVSFAFYIALSLWGFFKFLHSDRKLFWALFIGCAIGFAVLTKWLSGFVVLGLWGLYLLQNKKYRGQLRQWKRIAVSFGIALLTFLPWQIFIYTRFPAEYALSKNDYFKHLFEAVEDHAGEWWYHLDQVSVLYGSFFIPFILFGIFSILKNKNISVSLSVSVLAALAIFYLFFSFTLSKMPSFTYPMSYLLWIIIAAGINYVLNFFKKYRQTYRWVSFLVVLSAGIYALNPTAIKDSRSYTNVYRQTKLHNTAIYKNLPTKWEVKDRVIVNCKPYEDIELMFYHNLTAYCWHTEKYLLDPIVKKGYKIAAFSDHGKQLIPEHFFTYPDILVLQEDIR